MKYKKIVALFATCIFSITMIAGCASPIGGGASDDAETVTEEEASLDVTIANPEIKDISISSNFSGTVVAESEIYVIPMIAGEVVEKNYEVGDHVNEGDLLFKIDDEALQIAVKQAEASVTSAQAGLASSQASAEYTRAQANTTRASAIQTVGEIPYNEQNIDHGVNSLYASKKSANHSYQNAMDSVDAAESTLDDLNDALDAARSARDTAKGNLEKLQSSGTASAEEIATAKSLYETYAETVETAKSRVESAERSLDAAKRAADDAETGYELAKESYELAQLQRDNYYTYDKAVTLYNTYANAVGANASDVGADASVTNSATAVKQAQLNLESAKLQLGYTEVTAPVSGTITAIGVTLHNMATQSSAAYTIQSDEPNKIVFYAAEETARNIRPGSDAIVTKNGVDYNAKIITVYDTIDAATGLFKIEASVSGATTDLISGSSVSIRTITRRSDGVLSVPIDCVYYDGDQAYVFVDAGGVARRTDVTTGLTDEESVEIVDGLNASSRVVVTWSSSMRDGTKINATGASATKDATKAADAKIAATTETKDDAASGTAASDKSPATGMTVVSNEDANAGAATTSASDISITVGAE